MHRSPVAVAIFSPDGKTALTATNDETAQLWDVATGKPIGPPLPSGAVLELPDRDRTVAALFRPEGKTVLIASSYSAHLWAVPPPMGGDADRIRLWVEVATGLELDASGAVVELDANAWRHRRERLQERGGRPPA
jgi:WD40 repeat protein